MVMFSLLLVFALSSVLVPVLGNGSQSACRNRDITSSSFYGSSEKSTPTTPEGCGQACCEHPDCTMWVSYKGSSSCYLLWDFDDTYQCGLVCDPGTTGATGAGVNTYWVAGSLDCDCVPTPVFCPAIDNCSASNCDKTPGTPVCTACNEGFGLNGAQCIIPTLQDKFIIEINPDVDIQFLPSTPSSTENGFTSIYTLTDHILEGDVGFELWDGPLCGVAGSNEAQTTVLTSTPSFSGFTSDRGPGIIDANSPSKYTLTTKFDASALVGTTVYSGSAKSGTVQFCVVMFLKSSGVGNLRVNFVETVFTVSIDLTAGFVIENVQVEKKVKDTASETLTYEVDAFECTADKTRISSADTRNQGSIINVCVTPLSDAQGAGIKMRSIDSFIWGRNEFANDPTASPVNQPAIVDGVESNNLLTSYDSSACRGQDICQFTSILFADFYKELGSVNGSGTAILQFGDAKSRRLRGDGDRILQEVNGDGEAADFDLTFVVNPTLTEDNSAGSMLAIFESMLLTALVGTAMVAMVM